MYLILSETQNLNECCMAADWLVFAVLGIILGSIMALLVMVPSAVVEDSHDKIELV